MEPITIRPRFKHETTLPLDQVLTTYQVALKQETSPVTGFVANNHVYLRIPAKEQHFWSPQLNLEVIETEAGSIIYGLFGPRESVWLMYIFFYTLLGFAALVITIMGFSQMQLGLSSRILWALPVLALITFFAVMTARTGQKLGKDQMNLLHQYYRDILGKCESLKVEY